MKNKNIELELRAEVSPKSLVGLEKKLAKIGKMTSHTRRLSVMHFGNIGEKKIDVRVRVTNRDCEIAVKFGSFDARDRVEISQAITTEQFLGMVRLFSLFGFETKIGERETVNYTLPDKTVVSLVLAGEIAYVEIEKMSTQTELKQNEKRLRSLAKKIGVKLLGSADEFDRLCDRLSERTDWGFSGTREDYDKLELQLSNHHKIRRR